MPEHSRSIIYVTNLKYSLPFIQNISVKKMCFIKGEWLVICILSWIAKRILNFSVNQSTNCYVDLCLIKKNITLFRVFGENKQGQNHIKNVNLYVLMKRFYFILIMHRFLHTVPKGDMYPSNNPLWRSVIYLS